MKLRDKIPPIYHTFFPDFLDLEIPEEKIATCENCTLCRPGEKSPYIDTKCCAYYPHLPNYLVGGILQDNDPGLAEGRRRIREVIGQKKGVSPYGLIPPVEYTKRRKEIYQKTTWKISHEENRSLLCPYYNDGACSVWKYRENLCVTFFCTHTAGSKGRTFWDKINQYLRTAEQELAKYALLQLGWPAEAIIIDRPKGEILRLDDEQGKLDDTRYAKLWREWQGREEALYGQCFQIINAIDRETFSRITGLSGEILEQSIINTQRDLASAVFPEFLQLNPETRFVQKDKDTLTLTTTRGSVEMPMLYLPYINLFNGERKTAEIAHLAYQLMIGLEEYIEKMIGIRALLPRDN